MNTPRALATGKAGSARQRLACLLLLLCAALCATSPGAVIAAEPAAEIISIQGSGQTRTDAGAAWTNAQPKQPLEAGHFVRTGEQSRMGLLFRDRTQLRLNEKTILQVKDVGKRTHLRLESGRAWTQSRTLPDTLYMETPSATAAIRGTDWDLEVDNTGRTTLTVFSGEVEFFNDSGTLRVAANEAAEARPGQTPTRLQLVRPRDRVQWVTGWRLEPLRELEGPSFAGDEALQPALTALRARQFSEAARLLAAARPADGAAATRLTIARAALAILEQRHADALALLAPLARDPSPASPAAHLLLAGLHNQAGRTADALLVLQQALAAFPDDPRLHAVLARTYLIADQREESRAVLEKSTAGPTGADLHIARGELARIEGDADGALAAFKDALDLAPSDDRALYQRGRVYAETGHTRRARRDLRDAIALSPDGTGYQGELGTLETQADRFDVAGDAFARALDQNPDDYVALTGRGLLALKRGRPDAALQDFLRAGIMEPRYARVRVYTAVAYYQLGYTEQALAELARASQLDDKDPLPHFMASLIHGDRNRPAAAIASAREAMRLMPYLKSLDQLANDQGGSANLGSAFAAAGMEEWAMHYAQNSYNSLWAGSHLFLSDRYPGLFTRNSSLFQGFLADPTAFGASNRFKTLMPRPENYVGVLYGYTESPETSGHGPQLKLNGLSNDVLPVAWFAQLGSGDFSLPMGGYERTENTAAIGLKPHHDVGVFLFATQTDNDFLIDEIAAPAPDRLHGLQTTTHGHAGLHYRFSPDSQLWFKGGRFDSDDAGIGLLDGQNIDSMVVVAQPEFSLRHSVALGDHELTWGAEHGKRQARWRLAVLDPVYLLPDTTAYYYSQRIVVREESLDGYLSWRWQPADWLQLQADAFRQAHDRISLYRQYVNWDPAGELLNDWLDEDYSGTRWRPRFGAWIRAREDLEFRVAHQRWQRPATFSTLGPVATVGIPLDDRMVLRGGVLERTRGQAEWELTPRDYLLVWADDKDIDNRPFRQSPFSFAELESLGNLRVSGAGLGDLLEFTDTPEYEAGRLRSGGVSLNHLLNAQWSLVGRYARHDGENTGATYRGKRLPFIPEAVAAAGATWTFGSGWRLESTLVHRTHRYADDANLVTLRESVDGTTQLSWRSADKRWGVRLAVDSLFNEQKSTQYTAQILFQD